MSRILITGSADGLGRLAAETLLGQGHQIVVHARNAQRALKLDDLVAAGAQLVVGDFGVRDEVHGIADELLQGDPFQAIIHNAGVWKGRSVMPVNIVAPYLLSARLPLPDRLVFVSSGSHYGGRDTLHAVDWQGSGPGSYSDSKLFVSTLAAAIARLHPEVTSNSVDPGWVPTRMGGTSATDDLTLGHRTQEWLAVSDDPQARFSGGYWFHQKRRKPHPAVADVDFQDRLILALATETGVPLP